MQHCVDCRACFSVKFNSTQQQNGKWRYGKKIIRQKFLWKAAQKQMKQAFEQKPRYKFQFQNINYLRFKKQTWQRKIFLFAAKIVNLGEIIWKIWSIPHLW